MKRVACTQTTPRPAPDQPTRKALDLLTASQQAVLEIVESRKQEKMSYTRASHVAREINEIIKVLSLYLPNEQ